MSVLLGVLTARLVLLVTGAWGLVIVADELHSLFPAVPEIGYGSALWLVVGVWLVAVAVGPTRAVPAGQREES